MLGHKELLGFLVILDLGRLKSPKSNIIRSHLTSWCEVFMFHFFYDKEEMAAMEVDLFRLMSCFLRK